MGTESLMIICDEVLSLEPTTNGQGANIVKMLLDDVDIDSLMAQIAVKCDAHTILDYLTNADIAEYMKEYGIDGSDTK